MMYCVDILDALTKDFFARKGNPIEEAVEINEVQVALERPGYDPVSSTLWRQREEFCAVLIQRFWRKYKNLQPGCSQSFEPKQGPSGSQKETVEESLSSSVIVNQEGVHKVVISNPHSKSSSISSHITDV